MISILFFLFSQSVSFANSCGQILQVTGKVDVLRMVSQSESYREAIPIKAPFSLLCTDVVVTRPASRAKIKLDRGMITLSPNTRLAVASMSKKSSEPTQMDLTFGKVRSFFSSTDSKEKNKKIKIEIKTPSAVVGVRGTDFFVSFDPNKDLTTQATLKGEVIVEQIGTGQKAVVPTGKKVDVQKVDIEAISKSTVKEDLKITENKSEVVSEKNEEKIDLNVQPLKVTPIDEVTVVAIRQTSPLIKQEEVFTSKEAVDILGTPEKWIAPKNELPSDLNQIENVF